MPTALDIGLLLLFNVSMWTMAARDLLAGKRWYDVALYVAMPLIAWFVVAVRALGWLT